LVAGTLVFGRPPTDAASPGAVRLAAGNEHLQRPSNRRDPGAVAWPRVQIEDPYTRYAATRALDGAVKWLAEVRCQQIFAEFTDRRGVPLGNRLREFGTSPEEYLRMLFFFDGAQHATCRRHGILAFTSVGSKSIYLCGRDFERAWKKNASEVQAAIIHETLHSLGLGENPPSARSINARVQLSCWR
jgi:hypothetical protein